MPLDSRSLSSRPRLRSEQRPRHSAVARLFRGGYFSMSTRQPPGSEDPGYSSTVLGAARIIYCPMDTNPISTGKILPPLDAATPEQVAAHFGELRARFDQDAAGAMDENGWKSLRDAWLGRKSGLLTQVTDTWLKPSKPELKRAVGQALNELKAHVEAALESRRAAIEASAEQTALAREREDLSLPGVARPLGSRHPLRQTFEEIERIFLSLGYSVVAGPEMETPYYNFEALNIPEHHPARDNMDTFYMAAPPGAAPLLLRTHTSPMQVRTMEKQQPPVRIIVPGKVYRRDNP